MNKISKAIGAAALAAGIIGGTIAVSAQTNASAATQCTTGSLYGTLAINMCNTAWARANMTPLSAQGVVQYGNQWCGQRQRVSYAYATDRLAATLGRTKANAIAFAADSWFC